MPIPMLSFLHLDEWQELIEAQPDSTIFHHPRWIELLMEQYGFRLQIPAIKRDGRILAAIPFLETKNLCGERKLVSLPFTDYVQPLTMEQQALEDLCVALRTVPKPKVESVVIRGDAPIRGVDTDSQNVRHELCTSRPLCEIEASFADSLKRNLRKTRARQLQFQRSTDESAMETFYRLHVMTRQKLGVPVQPKSFFRRLSEQVLQRGFGFVGVVTKENEPIAAAVFLTYNNRMIYKYAASHSNALEHRPNDCLVHNGIRLATEEGFKWFDFGISSKQQQGLCRFKRKWGATESDVYYNYVTGTVQQTLENSRAARLASLAIRFGPKFVCRSLGEVFYRFSQ